MMIMIIMMIVISKTITNGDSPSPSSTSSSPSSSPGFHPHWLPPPQHRCQSWRCCSDQGQRTTRSGGEPSAKITALISFSQTHTMDGIPHNRVKIPDLFSFCRTLSSIWSLCEKISILHPLPSYYEKNKQPDLFALDNTQSIPITQCDKKTYFQRKTFSFCSMSWVLLIVFVLPSLACVSSQGERLPTRNNSINENPKDLTKKFNLSWFL